MKTIRHFDIELDQLVVAERSFRASSINLIASENYPDPAVRALACSHLGGKYAEGYPGNRYYAGCQTIDKIEQLAIERAKNLFGAEHANVQPLSGTQANLAVYRALLQPGDCVLAMDLRSGGHLSHGSPVHISGQLYQFVFYGVDRTSEQIDYDAVHDLARQYKPKLIIAGASSYARAIDFERFAAIAADVGALLMVDMAHIAGLVATGLHQNPMLYADVVTSTIQKTLRGPRGGFILCKQNYAQAIDRAVMPGLQAGTNMGAIAAKALTFGLAVQPEFRLYQEQVITNARAMAEVLAAAGVRLVSGGTDTHMVLIDVGPLNLDGRQAEQLLERAGLVVNRNLIPFDERGPRMTSGVRIGTPAMTTCGMDQAQAIMIANCIAQVLKNPDEDTCVVVQKQVDALVRVLCYDTL